MTTASLTTQTNSASGFSPNAFEAFLDGKSEPAWLTERRRDAFALFQSTAWPTLRDEEWRRTDIRALKLAGFTPPSPTASTNDSHSSLKENWSRLREHYSAGIEHVDSTLTRTTDETGLPAGVVFCDLASALVQHSELIEKYLLTKAVDSGADALSALHGAFLSGGTFLYVPKGIKLEAPLFNLIGMSSSGRVDLNHTLVVLEEGAEATLVQEATGKGDGQTPSLHVGAIELIVGNRAKLKFVNVQNWDLGTWHFSRERALVGKEAELQWTVGGLGSRLSKVNQEVALTGERAKAQVNGVMFTTGRQHLAYFTRQDHQAPYTTSDLLYKGGLKDSSRVVWKGMIRVEPSAQKTDAYQKNDSLILSENSRADSIPGLEIEANDVRCTHGATAGPVDDEMIFYLRSRGIKRDEAVRLIVEGFFANVYDRISLEPVRETLRQAVADKLEL